jgi:hypothetical protein
MELGVGEASGGGLSIGGERWEVKDTETGWRIMGREKKGKNWSPGTGESLQSPNLVGSHGKMEEINGKAEEQRREEEKKIEWARWREADLAGVWYFWGLGWFLYGGLMQLQ